MTQKTSTATIDFTNQTAISEIDPAQLSDVTAGSCVAIRPTRDSAPNGPVTAHTVLVSPAGNGQCPQAHDGGRGVRGTVAAVNGNTIAVATATNPTPTTVGINDDTGYGKRVAASPQAITAGKCIAGRGTNDSSGAYRPRPSRSGRRATGPAPAPDGEPERPQLFAAVLGDLVRAPRRVANLSSGR